jgi:hypothetical protein
MAQTTSTITQDSPADVRARESRPMAHHQRHIPDRAGKSRGRSRTHRTGAANGAHVRAADLSRFGAGRDVERRNDGAYSNHRLRGGIRDDLRRSARFGRHAQTAINRWHESQDGRDLGHIPDLLDMVRPYDRVEVRRHVECDRRNHEFSPGCSVSVLSPQRSAIVMTAATATSRVLRSFRQRDRELRKDAAMFAMVRSLP